MQDALEPKISKVRPLFSSKLICSAVQCCIQDCYCKDSQNMLFPHRRPSRSTGESTTEHMSQI